MLDFLQPELANETIDLFEDNQGAIAMAENPISGGRTKHIDARYHFIRELVEGKVLKVAVNTIVPRSPFFAFCTPKYRLL